MTKYSSFVSKSEHNVREKRLIKCLNVIFSLSVILRKKRLENE